MQCPDRLGTRIATLHALQQISGMLAGQMAYPSAVAVYNLVQLAIDNIDTLPIDKLSRWLGYAQCYATMNSLGTVDEMRDSTRNMFHVGYELDGIGIPPTISASEYKPDLARSATLVEVLSQLAETDTADMPAIINTLQQTDNLAQIKEMCTTLLALVDKDIRC